MSSSSAHVTAPAEAGVIGKLSTLDRFLPVWIGVAMVAGLLLGRLLPGLNDALDAVRVGDVSLPIALGLLLMMYPVLAKVRYDRLDTVTGDRRLMAASLLLNWVIGPAVMFALAWLLLPDLPEYHTAAGCSCTRRRGRPRHRAAPTSATGASTCRPRTPSGSTTSPTAATSSR